MQTFLSYCHQIFNTQDCNNNYIGIITLLATTTFMCIMRESFLNYSRIQDFDGLQFVIVVFPDHTHLLFEAELWKVSLKILNYGRLIIVKLS